MSADAILRAIEFESEREVAAILADAGNRAERLVAEAEAAAERRVSEGLAAVEPELQADAARRVNAARLRLLHARAERRARRVALVFERAEEELRLLAADRDDRWQDAMARLAAAACRQAGDGGRLLADEPDQGDGVQAVSADGRLTVDSSIATRLQRARRLLIDEVVEALGT